MPDRELPQARDDKGPRRRTAAMTDMIKRPQSDDEKHPNADAIWGGERQGGSNGEGGLVKAEVGPMAKDNAEKEMESRTGINLHSAYCRTSQSSRKWMFPLAFFPQRCARSRAQRLAADSLAIIPNYVQDITWRIRSTMCCDTW